jgi:hypothetical protein
MRVDDKIRCDLEGCDKQFIYDALTSFLETAPNKGRALIEIRLSRFMLDKLELENGDSGSFFKGVPVRLWDTGFDETIEVVFGSLPSAQNSRSSPLKVVSNADLVAKAKSGE